MVYHRDVSKPVQLIRTLLLGRSWNDQNRFQDMLSPRPYPKPKLVIGSAHKPVDNYYCFRDPRRAVMPPEDLTPKLLGDGKSPPTDSSSKNVIPPTPGKVYNWD